MVSDEELRDVGDVGDSKDPVAAACSSKKLAGPVSAE